MYKLADATARANMFEILSGRKEKFFMGYPVEFVAAMPSTEANSQICCLLGDLQMGAYLGERRELRIDRSEHAYFGIGPGRVPRVRANRCQCLRLRDTTNPGPIVGLIMAAA